MFRIGLNPYGVAYAIGLFGSGTDRPNPHPLGLHGLLNLADKIGAAGVELPIALLREVPANEIAAVRARLHANGRYSILMHGIPWGDLDGSLDWAARFGIPIVRLHLTAILCGARGQLGAEWPRLIASARGELKAFARKAAAAGVLVTVEDHQDLTSAELLDICAECGPNVGVCLDTGNPLSVGEDPLEFARAVAPLVRHVHLKDYKVFPSGEGYRLKRCAIGSGAVPFKEIAAMLAPFGALPASIEPGALTERHIRVKANDFWNGYAVRISAEKIDQLQQRCEAPDVDWRTPWELGASAEDVVKYELDELNQSVENLKRLGLIQT